MLCLSILITSVVADPMTVRADPWLDFVNKCQNSMISFARANTGLSSKDIMGYAYLVGTDDIADKSWEWGYDAHDLYAVEPGTQINGKTINSKYLPQDNDEYLKTIKEEYLQGDPEKSDAIYYKPEGFQGTCREGTKFMVFDCDEEWVTVWDEGLQIWNVETGIIHCSYGVDAYLETHPAGFYKIKRSEVWLDLNVNLPVNHPYNSEAAIPKAGDGVVTKLAKLRPFPNENEKTDWKSTPVYALPMGTEVNVVSTELVPSKTPGSTSKYYKVSFNGSSEVQNNEVYYLAYQIPGTYYIDSRYLNVTKKGEKTPEGTALGEITNVTSKEEVYAYKSKNIGSEHIGILTKGTEIEMFPKESDANWTTVYFSGQKCYVQTKYIKKGKYKVTDISELCIADVVKDQYVVGWNPGKNNVDFYVELAYKPSGKKKKKVLWKSSHYTDTKLTIARKYMSNSRNICVTVQANTKNGDKGESFELPIFSTRAPMSTSRMKKYCIKVGKNKIKFVYGWNVSVQYSTKKNFKKAKLVEKKVKKKGHITYKQIKEIKKLKPNKTYYIRYRTKEKVYTAAGEKWISGLWSKPIKIKTKKK